MTYGNIGGIALLFFIFTALASGSEKETDTENSMSIRSTLVILFCAAVFGLIGEYATVTKIGNAWTNFGLALASASVIGGLYAFFRFVTKIYNSKSEINNISVETEAS
ncbi:MAG: hypothetical protein KA731_02335 [Candidatus Moranbacteria bacterium]|nr:hypothetical protein [Candidatus Moranbacteria bacterium]